MPIQFHLDESVSNSIAVGLGQRGFSVTTSGEVGLLGAADEAQLNYARETGRVVFTHDDDFLALHDRGFPHVGIVFSPSQTRSIGELIRGLILVAEILSPEEMRDHVEFI
jgi:predicted nuclease of predicted toxin-antitoxin system